MKKVLSVLGIVVFCVFISCSNQPSNETILSLIQEYKLGYIGMFKSKANIHYDELSIVERGEHNKEGKYIPVKIYAKGYFTEHGSYNPLTGVAHKHDFNRVYNVKIGKDDYGKWQILSAWASS